MPIEEQVAQVLIEKGVTVCTAESCTGGLIAHLLTNIAGSSAYMNGGIVAYSNSIKSTVLGVQEGNLIEYGAVSEQVAREMAYYARAMFSADYALSVTGIAGPGGGTAEKPVGLTYIGLAKPNGIVRVERYVWDGSREENKFASAEAALKLLLNALNED